VPFIVLNGLVTLLKVAVMAGAVWLIKWVAQKIKQKKEPR